MSSIFLYLFLQECSMCFGRHNGCWENKFAGVCGDPRRDDGVLGFLLSTDIFLDNMVLKVVQGVFLCFKEILYTSC